MASGIHHHLRPGWRPRVLFDVRNGFGFDAQGPVVHELLRRHHVRVDLASGTLSSEVLADMIAMHGVPDARVVSPALARRGRYEAVIITDSPSVRGWRSTTVIYLHHGTSFGNLDPPYALAFLLDGTATHLLALSDAEVTHFVARGGAGLRRRMFVTGQPKLDRLVNGAHDRERFLRSVGLDPSRPTVMLASHWRPESLFRSVPLDLLAGAFEGHRINLLVTAHSHLFRQREAKFSGGVDWDHELRCAFHGDFVRVFASVRDNTPLLHAADLLVADQTSVHAEYAVLGRPMVIYNHPSFRYGDSITAELLRATSAFVDDPAALGPAIAAALRDPNVDRAARARYIDHVVSCVGRGARAASAAIEAIAGVVVPPGTD